MAARLRKFREATFESADGVVNSAECCTKGTAKHFIATDHPGRAFEGGFAAFFCWRVHPSCSRASTYLPNPGRADLQSAVWNRRFGIYTAGFSTALAIIAFENCFRKFSIHIPNWRFQTADCRSALDSASMLMPRSRRGTPRLSRCVYVVPHNPPSGSSSGRRLMSARPDECR